MNAIILEFAYIPAVADDCGGFEFHIFHLSLFLYISLRILGSGAYLCQVISRMVVALVAIAKSLNLFL